MTVTWLALAILAMASLIISFETWKGMKRGLFQSVIVLSADVLSVIFGIIAARVVSLLVGGQAIKWFVGATVYERLKGMTDIVHGFGQMLLSSVLIVVFFFVFRAVLRLFMRIITSGLRRYQKENERNSVLDSSEKKNSDMIRGSLVGAVCGIIALSVVVSPIMGTLKVAGDAIVIVDGVSEDAWKSMKLKGDEIHKFEKYSNDIVGNICYALGGQLIYRASAYTRVNGEYISIPDEVSDISESMNDLMSVLSILEQTGKVTKNDKEQMDEFCDSIEDCVTMRNVTASFISLCAKAWLNDKAYLGINPPRLGESADLIFKDVLSICQSTNQEYVAQDMRSFFNVYTIIVNSELSSMGFDIGTQQLSSVSSLMEDLEAEIEKNPRIAPIRNSMRLITVKMISKQINNPKYNAQEYQALMENLATAINTIKSDKSVSKETQIRRLTAYTNEYISDFGLNVSGDIASIASKALLEEFGNSFESVDASSIEEYFNAFLN